MAIGTITLGIGRSNARALFADLISFPADAAYPTGGSATFEASFRAAVAGQRDVVAVVPQDCGGYVPVYDRANDKLKVYYGDNDGGADGPLIEVPNATDLSGVTFNLLVLSV